MMMFFHFYLSHEVVLMVITLKEGTKLCFTEIKSDASNFLSLLTPDAVKTFFEPTDGRTDVNIRQKSDCCTIYPVFA